MTFYYTKVNVILYDLLQLLYNLILQWILPSLILLQIPFDFFRRQIFFQHCLKQIGINGLA